MIEIMLEFFQNSIRHNLSLHNRFMRVQNEGTGKSSWWVLNPDAKPGKTPRRRAASMDPKEMAKKRGRAKKRVEQLRTGDFENYRQNSNPGSEFSSTSDLSSISGDPFALSPHDIRARTGSNASSFGRLSPIQAGVEPEIDDGFGSSWGECLSNGKEYVVPDRHITSGAESVSEHLAELFMGDSLSMPEKTQPSNIVGNHTSMNCSIGMMEQSGFLPNPPAYSSHPIGLQQHRGTYGTVRNDGLGAISSVSMLPPMPSRELYKNSEPFVSSPGYPKTTMSGMSLRDLLSDSSSDVTQHHGQDFTVDVKFLQECAIPPNRNLPSPKEITRTPPSNAFMPSIRISPQHQQPMMVGGITNAIMQQQQQQQQCSPNSPPQQQQYNAQIYRNLQQRMSSENLLQAVQMKGMQAQMLRCSPTIKQEPLSFPASPIVAKSEPVSPVSCMPASPTNRVSGCRLSANDLTRHYSYIKQENQLVGGNYGTSDSFSTYPPPLPMDLDFSLQELRAGGLECDVDSILQEGNFDLDFHSGMSGISGDMPFS